MCAIFGSKEESEFLKLAELNKHRGSASYSLMGFSKNLNIIHLKKHTGEFNAKNVSEVFMDSNYVIGHIQDPTDGRGNSINIHPAHKGSLYLYHNGMIRSQAISELDGYRAGIWDTELLINRIDRGDFPKSLNSIVGSFACVLIDASSRSIKLFTNNMCSLYINFKTMSISSTKENGFKKIKTNNIYNFNPIEGIYELEDMFNSSEDIYFIPE